ncbi:hypothetical protein [uncultured Nostoc sp.]|uniref:hypothetical protein n=1 Tax=uncultured Nostoc sp. TaxID=340711 RepID=UPI0035CA580D
MDFLKCVTEVLEDLIEDQYPINSRNEPLPRKIELAEGWSFHNLKLKVSKGASGQIRLMYLVNTTNCVIKLVWIYSHEQFDKRPTKVDLKKILQ